MQGEQRAGAGGSLWRGMRSSGGQCLGRWCGFLRRSLLLFLPGPFLRLHCDRSSCILVYRFLRAWGGGGQGRWQNRVGAA